MPGPQDDGNESSALPVVTIGQSVSGAMNEEIPAFPRPNGTEIWTVVIGDVDAEEPFGTYKATLIHNGQVLIGPETVKPGRLGQNGNYQLYFFEATPNGGCGPMLLSTSESVPPPAVHCFQSHATASKASILS
ncbi:MAG: hypothetical protein V3U09_02425 [Thermoplasmata archaeon]